jgi:hypothetical protein
VNEVVESAGEMSIDYNKINSLISEYNISPILENVQYKALICSIFYLLGINLEEITDLNVKRKMKEFYEKRFLGLPKYIGTDFTNDIFLEQVKVWYTSYFLEEFWNCDLKDYMDEYKKFINTRQSYLLYWTSLVNISILLSKIEACEYYIMKDKKVDIIPNKDNKTDFNFNNRYGIGTFALKSNVDAKKYFPSDNWIQSPKFDVFKIDNWLISKKQIVNLLINALDCNYNNIYLLYKKFICFAFSFSVDNTIVGLPKYLQYICSQFGSEHDANPDNIGMYKNVNEFYKDEKIENYESLETEKYEKEFLYLSLILPTAKKYARHEFTRFVPTCINPIYNIDESRLNLPGIIGHDFSNHRVSERKKDFLDNNPDIDDFLNYVITNKKEDFLIYVHGLFHENRSSKPFSYETLNERLRDVTDEMAFRMNEELTREIIDEFKKAFKQICVFKFQN